MPQVLKLPSVLTSEASPAPLLVGAAPRPLIASPLLFTCVSIRERLRLMRTCSNTDTQQLSDNKQVPFSLGLVHEISFTAMATHTSVTRCWGRQECAVVHWFESFSLQRQDGLKTSLRSPTREALVCTLTWRFFIAAFLWSLMTSCLRRASDSSMSPQWCRTFSPVRYSGCSCQRKGNKSLSNLLITSNSKYNKTPVNATVSNSGALMNLLIGPRHRRW